MSKNFELGRLLAALVGPLCLCLAWPADGQPATYTYDGAGNATVRTPGASGPPAFLSVPQAQLLESNSFASFSVSASGSGLTYQWLSNGVAIAGATGDSLVLSNLPLVGTNLGNFSVIVSNSSGAITNTPVALWSDANANGIPDWWELQYFGNLNQTASGDFDGDGVANLDEYVEGTIPNNSASFNPRLRVSGAHGTISASPDLPYYAKNQLVTLTGTPDPGHEFVSWSGSVTGTKSNISFLMNTNKTVVATFGLPLAQALENTNLTWITSGNALWFGQVEVTEDGIAAAQSGPIVSLWDGSQFVGAQTVLQTTTFLSQPTQLGFWWNVSSRPPAGISFAVNGTTLATLSGEAVGWQHVQTNLLAGNYTFSWTYSKGPVDVPTGVPFSDAAWVGGVTLVTTTNSPTPPVLSIRYLATNQAMVYWPASATTFALQQNSLLGSTNWSPVTNTITNSGPTNLVIISPITSNRFYRLVYP